MGRKKANSEVLASQRLEEDLRRSMGRSIKGKTTKREGMSGGLDRTPNLLCWTMPEFFSVKSAVFHID